MKKQPVVLIYLENIFALKGLSKCTLNILLDLLRDTSCMMHTTKKHKQLVYMNFARKKDLAERNDISTAAVTKALSVLTKKGVLIHVATGTYQINTNLFWLPEDVHL